MKITFLANLALILTKCLVIVAISQVEADGTNATASAAGIFDVSSAKTNKPSVTNEPTTMKPAKAAKASNTNPACVSSSTYDAIDADIANVKDSIVDVKARGRFLGGIVRLVAHDFMDFDQTNITYPMGPDGCFDTNHSVNTGLNTIWCANCTLTMLHGQKYSHISKADFWVAAANAVIRQTSVNNALDMKKTFRWGRKDADSCPSAGPRIPRPTNCTRIETVFLTKMGLTWRDAVVLMGAHTLGRGNVEFSGHEGLWKDTEEAAQIFDKQYYDEMFTTSWRPRNPGPRSDWTTGSSTDPIIRMMLNTDLCFVYDIGSSTSCCTGDACEETTEPLSKCPVLSATHARYETLETVEEMLSGDDPDDNAAFYDAYEESWNKATTLGQLDLFPLKRKC